MSGIVQSNICCLIAQIYVAVNISWAYYASFLIGGGIKRWCCLSVAYIGPRKTKIGTEVVHVTHASDTTFKVKGQGHQAALLTTVLMHQAAASVSVATYCYIAVCTLQAWSARQNEALRCPHREERGVLCSRIVAATRLQLVNDNIVHCFLSILW